MHQIADQMPEVEAWYSPFFAGELWDALRNHNLMERTIAGNRHRQRCLNYLRKHQLCVDDQGRQGGYNLVLNCTDVVVASSLIGTPMVLVQEGILDPPNAWLPLVKRFPQLVPRWLCGTAATGLSRSYQKFCVASQGYADYFTHLGVPRERLVVTGIPNFDNCVGYLDNDFPHHHYVLVCTSDARETFKRDDRAGLVRSALGIAAGRQLIFKLHPNEDIQRATAEITELAPQALIYSDMSAEHLIANCDVYIGQYSSTAFVALALNKEVHAYWRNEELRHLMPEQNGCAASNIARVCSLVLEHSEAPSRHSGAEPLIQLQTRDC
jgi:hypothetical protein